MAALNHPQDDARTWADWVQTHGPAVRGYLMAMLRQTELADELSQETFFRAWQARDRYREEGNARAYLLRIADHLVCDRARKSVREVQVTEERWKQVEPISRPNDPADAMIRDEAVGQLNAAMEHLSPIQRRVLLLRYYGDASFAEIAEILECPLGTALSHCHRGLQTLREQLVESES
jgi:RNA polymerase sigma-70 factor (ECF subfamily)